jgi:ribonuclease HII
MVTKLSWHFENQSVQNGLLNVAGIDEAGRGCLAGPVVAGAVIFLERHAWPDGLDDSKKLSPKTRQRLFAEITNHPHILYAIGLASVAEIDQINILQASFLAMQRAAHALPIPAQHFLIDGSQKPPGLSSTQCIVKGDGISPSIAAASILAKVTRDSLMADAEKQHPGYGFKKHKGYGTAAHIHALTHLGPCPLHRRTFAPVRQLLCPIQK